MLISHKNKFIFIHIYKTAGTSITDVLTQYSRPLDRIVYDYKFTQKLCGHIMTIMGWQDDGWKQFTGYHKHATASEVKQKLGAKKFDQYYSFAFVRNPFDWLVSLYFYIKQQPEHQLYRSALAMEFPEFIRTYLAKNPKTQSDFILDAETGQLLLDYVGRFETLNEDLRKIESAIGVSHLKQICHKNSSRLRNTKDYKFYFDKDSRAMVETYFRSDLDRFNYSFD